VPEQLLTRLPARPGRSSQRVSFSKRVSLLKLVYDRAARFGQQFGIELDGAALNNLSRIDAKAYLKSKGLTAAEIRQAFIDAAANAIATAEQRAQALRRFIDANCYAVAGALIPFSEFYARFLDSLPREERYRWTRYRVSHALPRENPSGSHVKNQKFVANVAWEPCTPGPPFVVVPGNKKHGRARILCH